MEVAQQDIIRTLKERRYCSTMFDYYAMPTDRPGRKEAATKPWPERASHVEGMILADIVMAMGGSFDPKYFIPYVQLHEFEALVFSNVETLVSVLSPIGRQSSEGLVEKFSKILSAAGHPEAINDGHETCPFATNREDCASVQETCAGANCHEAYWFRCFCTIGAPISASGWRIWNKLGPKEISSRRGDDLLNKRKRLAPLKKTLQILDRQSNQSLIPNP